jgi:acetyl-CoA carboxylase biotin carboxyl carrier protein
MKASGKKPTPKDLTYDDVVAIVRLIESGSRFTDFRLRHGDIEVEIHRANGNVIPDGAPGAVIPGGAAAPMARDPIGPRPSAAPAAAGATLSPDLHVIRSPMVGTFYRASEPGAKPFVEEGARVAPDTVVCIIEVMKLMNSISAGSPGRVTHVLVNDAEPVDMGQALIVIDPKG